MHKVIGNIIFVEFKPDQLLSKVELDRIEKRFDQISKAIDLCSDCGRDEDVLANLETELEMHMRNLERNLEPRRKRKKT